MSKPAIEKIFPEFRGRIQAARREGYSDEEIFDGLMEFLAPCRMCGVLTQRKPLCTECTAEIILVAARQHIAGQNLN